MTKKHVLKNKEIRRISDNVLNAVRLTDVEIDRIVADPNLVDRLRAAIESGRAVTDEAGASSSWPFRYTLRRQNAWAAATAAVLMLAGVVGLSVIANQSNTTSDLAEIVLPVKVPQVTPSVVDIPEGEFVARGGRKVRERVGRRHTMSTKTRSVKSPRQPKELEMGEFQALTYAGEMGEPGDGGRIVRVELSPASLFAMGINVQVENGTGKIPADLLINADGVMTGVRLEKKN
jgi:hypothetical protein